MNEITSDTESMYRCANGDAVSKSAVQLSNETLRMYADPGYLPPTPEEIRSVMQMLGKTAEQLALLVGVRNGRAVRRWLAPPTAKSHAQIDYAIWRLMLLEAGLIEPPIPLMQVKTIRSKRPILNLTDEQSDM
jgi:hypothetical protein